MNYLMVIEYNGKFFCGWQIQNNGRTVQYELKKALEILFKENITIFAAGRTDSGVHAKGQVVNFHSDKKMEESELIYRLNAILPNDVAIRKVKLVDDDFHARFSAIAREYEYLLYPGKSAIYNGFCWQYRRFIDDSFLELNEQLGEILGENDFQSFCKSATKLEHYRCFVEFAKLEKKENFFSFSIKANRFVHNMVRILVGTLIEIYEGKIKIRLGEILMKNNRSYAGRTAPSSGLYLKKVYYNEVEL